MLPVEPCRRRRRRRLEDGFGFLSSPQQEEKQQGPAVNDKNKNMFWATRVMVTGASVSLALLLSHLQTSHAVIVVPSFQCASAPFVGQCRPQESPLHHRSSKQQQQQSSPQPSSRLPAVVENRSALKVLRLTAATSTSATLSPSTSKLDSESQRDGFGQMEELFSSDMDGSEEWVGSPDAAKDSGSAVDADKVKAANVKIFLPPMKQKRRSKYERKRALTPAEKKFEQLRQKRQAEYESVRNQQKSPSIWSFDSLFPQPVVDEETVKRDLYELAERDKKMQLEQLVSAPPPSLHSQVADAIATPTTREVEVDSSKMDRKSESFPEVEALLGTGKSSKSSSPTKETTTSRQGDKTKISTGSARLASAAARGSAVSSKTLPYEPPSEEQVTPPIDGTATSSTTKDEITGTKDATRVESTTLKDETGGAGVNETATTVGLSVDKEMTRMVQDRVYGYRRGSVQYEPSSNGDGAVQFRDGVRLGKPLKVNCDRLTYFAKQEMKKNRLDEAKELYEMALRIDPQDGRPYLGLSRIAQRRRDFASAREYLRIGIAASKADDDSDADDAQPQDRGANPFLLQALGVLEEKMGHLTKAEALYVAAVKSRPSHAAAWVALGKLRTEKLRQGVSAGRLCFQSAERELNRAGVKKPSAYVYTAWASIEYKKAGDVSTARFLLKKALEVDPHCSAARLQLGVLESSKENWDAARECFEQVLKRDQRNSRVLQAYALMESKCPNGDSRKALELFERALKVQPRDAGALQAYALYVAQLGDIDAARKLLQRGTQVDKRHAPVWQAWGVLETRHGSPEVARDVFQQGIWACAQPSGGQSGGPGCARLWQGWGVLEAREGDHAAARRCFSRALDADSMNVAAISAWAQMEETVGRIADARLIYEGALKRLPSLTDDKMKIWRAYELMEERCENPEAAQKVYQRSIREAMSVQDVVLPQEKPMFLEDLDSATESPKNNNDDKKNNNEIEVSTWKKEEAFESEVWFNDGMIEGKVPPSRLQKSQKDLRRKPIE